MVLRTFGSESPHVLWISRSVQYPELLGVYVLKPGLVAGSAWWECADSHMSITRSVRGGWVLHSIALGPPDSEDSIIVREGGPCDAASPSLVTAWCLAPAPDKGPDRSAGVQIVAAAPPALGSIMEWYDLRVSAIPAGLVPTAPVAGCAGWTMHESDEHVFQDYPRNWLQGDVSVPSPVVHYPCNPLLHLLMAGADGVLPPKLLYGTAPGSRVDGCDDGTSFVECVAPRIPIVRLGFVPDVAPLAAVDLGDTWKPAGSIRFRIDGRQPAHGSPAWFDIMRLGSLTVLDIVTDAFVRPRFSVLARDGLTPRWLLWDKIWCTMREGADLSSRPRDLRDVFPPGMGPRGFSDTLLFASAVLGRDAVVGTWLQARRTYVVLHLVVPDQLLAPGRAASDEASDIRQFGHVAEALVIGADPGVGIVASPFFHAVGSERVPLPGDPSSLPFDSPVCDDGLPSAVILLMVWDLVVRSKVVLVHVEVGGQKSAVDRWLRTKVDPEPGREALAPTFRDLLLRGHQWALLRALVGRVAAFAHSPFTPPVAGVSAEARRLLQERDQLRKFAEGIPGDRFPSAPPHCAPRVHGTLLRRGRLQIVPTCGIWDCGLHGWASARRERAPLVLSAPVRLVWTDLSALIPELPWDSDSPAIVRKALCEGDGRGFGAYSVCAGWPAALMLQGDLAIGEYLEARTLLLSGRPVPVASPQVPGAAEPGCDDEDVSFCTDRVSLPAKIYIESWLRDHGGMVQARWRRRFPTDPVVLRRYLEQRAVGLAAGVLLDGPRDDASGRPPGHSAHLLSAGCNFAAARVSVRPVVHRLAVAYNITPSSSVAWLADSCDSLLSHAGFLSTSLLCELLYSLLWMEAVKTCRIVGALSSSVGASAPPSSRSGAVPVLLQPPPARAAEGAPSSIQLGSPSHMLQLVSHRPDCFPADVSLPDSAFHSPKADGQIVDVLICPHASRDIRVPEAVLRRRVAGGRVSCALQRRAGATRILGEDVFQFAVIPVTMRPETACCIRWFHSAHPADDPRDVNLAQIRTGIARVVCSAQMSAIQVEQWREDDPHNVHKAFVVAGFGGDAVCRVQLWPTMVTGVCHLLLHLLKGRWRSTLPHLVRCKTHLRLGLQGSPAILCWFLQLLQGLHFGAGLHVSGKPYLRPGVAPQPASKSDSPSIEHWGCRACPGLPTDGVVLGWIPHVLDFDVSVVLEKFDGGRVRATVWRDPLGMFRWTIDGVTVSKVVPGSTVESAGISPGMVFVSIGGKAVKDARDVQLALARAQDADCIDLVMSSTRRRGRADRIGGPDPSGRRPGPSPRSTPAPGLSPPPASPTGRLSVPAGQISASGPLTSPSLPPATPPDVVGAATGGIPPPVPPSAASRVRDVGSRLPGSGLHPSASSPGTMSADRVLSQVGRAGWCADLVLSRCSIASCDITPTMLSRPLRRMIGVSRAGSGVLLQRFMCGVWSGADDAGWGSLDMGPGVGTFRVQLVDVEPIPNVEWRILRRATPTSSLTAGMFTLDDPTRCIHDAPVAPSGWTRDGYSLLILLELPAFRGVHVWIRSDAMPAARVRT